VAFDVLELTIAQAQAAMAGGSLTARALTAAYLDRVGAIDQAGPTLRSIIELNPAALDLAAALDAERARGAVRGPLHGVPVLLKDNIDTADQLQTTAGSLALLNAPVAQDAPVVARLRRAGAVILGKTNMSEWANFRATHSASGWSGRGRQTRNPYVLDRTPSGSSSGSGVAVAANLCLGALGTETDGSIVSPSSVNGIVGIKPTVGLTSRQGVVPISHSQDTVGPHARTVTDAAHLLSAIAERGLDYAAGLDPNALRGARLGAAREFHTGLSQHADRLFEDVLDVLRRAGAEVVDVTIPGQAEIRANQPGTNDTPELIRLQYDFKADLAAYLATRPRARIRTVEDLVRFNEAHADVELPYFGQDILVRAEARGPLTDPLYRVVDDRLRRFAAGFGQLFRDGPFDALVAPTNSPAGAIDLFAGDHRAGHSSQAAAAAGFPLVTVPAGFAADLLPLGLTFMGPADSEPRLINLAYAFERRHPARRAPMYVPTTLTLP
jgi:amidase